MPELPEVETVMQGVAPYLTGCVITEAAAHRPDLRWPLPERFADRLRGRRVLGLHRRSKYILIDLAPGGGAAAESWIVHLGMSGRILVHPKDAARDSSGGVVGDFAHDTGAAPVLTDPLAGDPGPHDHVVVATDKARLVYNDPRRFGAMDLWPTADLAAHPLLAKIGPEPLGNQFSGAYLAEKLTGRSAPIKAALLDQRIVAGLGNIYVCEALFRAGVHPARAAGGIAARRLERLAAAVRDVLEEAIIAGGSSLRDYRQADGELGYFQHRFSVYGRAGEPCHTPRCKGAVERIVQSGRSSFFCPRCQR